MESIESIVRIGFISVVVVAAFYDFRQRRIPNYLTIGTMLCALVFQCWFHGFTGLATWFLGLAAGAGLLAIPYALGGMGAGDLKLLASAGCMLGPSQVFYAFIAASVLGGLQAIAALSSQNELEPETEANSIPYGLPLAAGVLLSAAGAWLPC